MSDTFFLLLIFLRTQQHTVRHTGRTLARRGRCCLLGGLWLIWFTATVAAQYRFDHWTTENGLPQNSVRDIVQTRDGYLWLTTFDGLVRFDGVRFTVFNKSNIPGLLSNRFIQLYEDKQGALWASLEESGLVRYWQGRFTVFTNSNGLPDNIVNSVGGGAQGDLLIAQGKLLSRWTGDKFAPAAELYQPLTGPLTEGTVNPWQHLLWLPGLRQTAQPWPNITSQPMQDRHGAIWFTTRTELIRSTNGQVQQIYRAGAGLPGSDIALVFGQAPLQVISRDTQNRLWLTEMESGQHRLLAAQAPEAWSPFNAYADREGNYWLSSGSNGLWRARQQVITALGPAQGLDSPETYSVLEDRDGSLWVGTNGKGLYRYQNGVFTPVKDPQKLSQGQASSLYQDRTGCLWVYGYSWLKDGSLTSSPLWSRRPSNLGVVWAALEDQQGAFWFGAVGGVVRWQQGQLTHFTTKDGLAGDNTTVIIPDNAGGLWLGSFGGVTHYRDGKFTAWTERDGVPGKTVRALKLDADGTLWIGTYDSGLGRFKDGQFTRYTTHEGLFDNGVFQILEDDQGWFWLSCNRGIYRVRKQELHEFAAGQRRRVTSIAYGKSDGMPSAECNGGRWPAGVKTRDGRLWFPTMGGLAVIDPTTIKTNTQPPPVVIETMRINNEALAPDTWQAAISNPPAAISLEPGQENFEIDYTALSFINSENLRFRYMLEGADSDWIEAGTRRTAFFSHVPPGSYTFKVIAANSDGVWGSAAQRLRLQILPPFYRTWWFLTLAALLGGGALLAANEYRINRLKQARAQQQAFARQLIESQEAERKRIAAELHDSLGQKLVVIKNLALLHLQRPDATTAHVEALSAEASQAISEVKEIAYNLRPYQLDRIGLTKAIEALVHKTAAASGIEFTREFAPIDGLLPKDAEINFYRIVQESLNNLLKHAQAQRAEVRILQTGELIELLIRDDGRGFTPAPGRHETGFGLIGLQERALLLAGTLTVVSAPGHGTAIRLAVPIPPLPPLPEEVDEP